MSKGGIVGFVCLIALAGRGEPAFQEEGKAFRFDTGCLRGVLRSEGRSLGIGPVTDTASGITVAGALALLGPYRLLDAEHRYLPVARYAGALGVRRDPASGLAALVMAPPDACFAVLMPYGEDGHRSIYHSLFGRDFKEGERAAARMRLVIERGVSERQAIERYQAFVKELKQR